MFMIMCDEESDRNANIKDYMSMDSYPQLCMI